MEKFDKLFLSSYLELKRKHDAKDRKVSNPFSMEFDILQSALDMLHKEAESLADSELYDVCDEYNGHVSNQEFSFYSGIIKKALVNILYENKEEDAEKVNQILKSDFTDLIREFRKSEELSYYLLEHYIKFLIRLSNSELTSDIIKQLLDKHPWLETISYSKGYMTINEKAREVILDIYGALYDVDVTTKQFYDALDDYFRNEQSNYFFRDAFPEINSKDGIKKMKDYQLRLIVSDAFLLLKAWHLKNIDSPEDEDLEFNAEAIQLLETIEEGIVSGNFDFLASTKMRHNLYACFIFFNDNPFYFNYFTDILKSYDEDYHLKMINPLYFLD